MNLGARKQDEWCWLWHGVQNWGFEMYVWCGTRALAGTRSPCACSVVPFLCFRCVEGSHRKPLRQSSCRVRHSRKPSEKKKEEATHAQTALLPFLYFLMGECKLRNVSDGGLMYLVLTPSPFLLMPCCPHPRRTFQPPHLFPPSLLPPPIHA